MTWTPCGFIQHKVLTRHPTSDESSKCGSNPLPTDVGSRIGVMFVPTGSNSANMHFIINGEDQGPCSRDIPFLDGPIYAVVDVYGCTKRVRTCQIYGGNIIKHLPHHTLIASDVTLNVLIILVDSLQSMCRDVILNSIRISGVMNLPLPNLLKNYLLFH